MANFPGTYEVRTFYTTSEPAAIASHEYRWSLEMAAAADPGDPFSDWSVALRGGGSSPLDVEVDNIHSRVDDLFHTSTDFINAELWEYAPGTFDAVFRSSYTLGLQGTNVSATVAYAQSIMTFRSTLGGIMKLDLRGTVFGTGVRASFPTASPALNTLAAYIAGATTPVRARDGGFPMSPLFWLPGSNERAFKEVNR